MCCIRLVLVMSGLGRFSGVVRCSFLGMFW